MVRIISILFFLFLSLNANARKPALEEFSGVVPVETVKQTAVISNQSHSSENSVWLEILVILGFISLPTLVWFFIQNTSPVNDINPEDLNNIAHLDDYRKQDSDQDDIKKAS